MAEINFNTADAPEPDNNFAPIPAGEYPMRVINSEMRDTKAGNGKRLVLEIDITDGPHQGRKIWQGFNLVNPNPQAVEISQRQLAQLCLAVGKVAITNSDELHMHEFIGKVKVTPAQGGYDPGNEIVQYKPKEGNAGAVSARADTTGAAQNGSAAAVTGSGTKPNATKDPETGKWFDDSGNQVPVFKLSGYNKIEG